MIEGIFNDLMKNGHSTIQRSRANADTLAQMINVLEMLGFSSSEQVLMARNSDGSNTLSGRHGLDSFPLHTDGITQKIPTRFLILTADASRAAQTKILDPFKNNVLLSSLRQSLFQRKNLQASSFMKGISTIRGRECIRYNSDLLSPMNSHAEKVIDTLSKIAPNLVDWNETYCVILDNWRVLHGRTLVDRADVSGLQRFRFEML